MCVLDRCELPRQLNQLDRISCVHCMSLDSLWSQYLCIVLNTKRVDCSSFPFFGPYLNYIACNVHNINDPHSMLINLTTVISHVHILLVRLFQHIIFEHLSNVRVEDSTIKIISHVTAIVNSSNLCMNMCSYTYTHRAY